MGGYKEEESIPTRFQNPVEVPPAVFEGLEAVQQLGQTSMLDHQTVQFIATRIGYPVAALWVREHQYEYTEGLFRGFVAAQ